MTISLGKMHIRVLSRCVYRQCAASEVQLEVNMARSWFEEQQRSWLVGICEVGGGEVGTDGV